MGVLPDWMIERDVGITPFAPQATRAGVISYGVTSYGYDARLGYKFEVFQAYVPGDDGVPVIDPKAFSPKLLRRVDLTPRTHDWQEVRERQGLAREVRGTHVCKHCDQTCYDPPTFMQPCGSVQNYILIPPHSFVLGESVETFRIPRGVTSIVLGKSTYARCGLIVNVTPLEPDWEGVVTIELSNTTPLPMKVYCGEGIMQVVFIQSAGYTDLMVRVFKEWFAHKGTFETVFGSIARWSQLFTTTWDTFWGKVTCDKSYADKKGKYQNQAGLTLPQVDKTTGA